MVELTTSQLDLVFHALSDATRRAMVRVLAEGPRKVSELAAPFTMSLAAASKHVRVLERAGLLRREIRGRTHICTLNPVPLAASEAWIAQYEHFWNQRLDRLGALLAENKPTTCHLSTDERNC